MFRLKVASAVVKSKFMLRIEIVPALRDNYCYLLEDTTTGIVGVVDPSEAEPVEKHLKGRKLAFILNTHHHWDHVGGNVALQEKYGSVIACSAFDRGRVPGKSPRALSDQEIFTLGASSARVIDIPGHTLGHIALHFEEAQAVFVGDTLFGAGCGRLFEGTADQMWSSLRTLRGLPDETRIYGGHEYTQDNIRFALTVEPSNQALQRRAEQVRKLRGQGLPTMPLQLIEERETNPFLRADILGIPFAEIRKMKDNFA